METPYDEYIGRDVREFELGDWPYYYPVVDADTFRIVAIADCADDLTGYELRDIVHGRLVARECASDVLVSRP